MSEYSTSEVNEMQMGPEEILLGKIKRSVLSNEAPNWDEMLESSESELGQIIGTRLSINGFWKQQSRQLFLKMSDIQLSDVESRSTEFINGLNNSADVMTGAKDREDFDESSKCQAENRQLALSILNNEDSLAFAQSIMSMKNDKDFKSTNHDKLLLWLNSSRSQVAEDIWQNVQDFREDRDLGQFRQSIDDSFAKMNQLASGSILQR